MWVSASAEKNVNDSWGLGVSTELRTKDNTGSNDAAELQSSLSDYRKRIIHDIQTKQLNIEAMTVFMNLVQESQELLSALRHSMRGKDKFEE